MTKRKKLLSVAFAMLIIIVSVALLLIFAVFDLVGDEGRDYRVSQIVESNINTGKTVIDDTVTYQSMNGFGASACWWSQDVGSWENRDEIMSYLYDREKGIGLNIYRYNLGAGSKGDEHITIENRGAECFLKPDGTYDFTADKSAQLCLAAAKKYAGNDMRVTLFCNSPPVTMTKNGAGYCSPVKDKESPYESNIDEKNYPAFADFCYNSAEHFVNEGYRVTDVSPINEPQFDWRGWYNEDGTYSAKQEGCYYSKTQATDLYNVMIDRFDGSDLDSKNVKISMFECAEAAGEGSASAAYMDCLLGKSIKYAAKNKKLRNYFDCVSTHSYWSSTETKTQTAKYLFDKYSKYDIACTEYCQMWDDENTGVYHLIAKEKNGTNGMTIDYGVAMAKVIVDDLTILNAKEWDWWTACSYGVYTDGLIYLNPDNHSDIQISKRMWCLGNFSRFIDEGATRIACSSGVDSVSSCAFINPDNSRVVVYVNNTDKDQKTVLNCNDDYSVYTTSDKYDLQKTANGKAGQVNVSIPAMSVVTVICK